MGKVDLGTKALSHAAHKKKSATKLSGVHSLCHRTANDESCEEGQPKQRRRGDSPPTLPRRVMSISDSPPSLPRRVLSVSDSTGDFVNCAMRQRLSASVKSQESQGGGHMMHNAVFPPHALPCDFEPMAPPPRKALNPFLDLSGGSDKPPRQTAPGYLKVDRPPTLPRVRRARCQSNGSVSGLSALTASIRIQSSGNGSGNVAGRSSANTSGSVRSR